MAHPHAPEVPAFAPPVALPTTYRELLSDESNSPARDRLASYLHGYRFEGAAPLPVPAALKDQTVVLSDRQPMTFLCLVVGPGGTPEVSVLHRMMRYMDMPGEEVSGYHDRVLGLLGDIMPHQYPAIEVPGSVFHLVGAPVRVPSTAALVAHIPAWIDPTVPLGPYTEEDPETEVVRPRHIQLVPGYYAAMLIHRRGLSAKVAFQEIHGAMQARDEVGACQDVITWLKAACTARGGGGLQNVVPVVYHPLAPVHLPADVYRYMIGKVRGDLPALATPDALTGELTGTLAGALRVLTGREADGGGDRPHRDPKTIQEVYKETFRTLLRYCNVAEPLEVSPVWRRLANCAKNEQHTVMTQEFQTVCRARGLGTDMYVPIVTTTLKQMIMGFQFAGHGIDDLSTGCQPFQVSYAGGEHQSEALDTASISNQLSQGEHNASLADYRTIREKEKIKFPRNISDTCITLSRYAVLCQTLFQGEGPPNPFVEALWHLCSNMLNAAPYITDRFQQVARIPAVANIYFASIIRAVQVGVQEYLQQVGTNAAEGHTGIDLPEFRTIVSDLRRGTFQYSSNWVPLPEEYLDPIRGGGGVGVRSVITNTTGSSSVSSTRTGVSSLTAEASRAPVARIDNPSPDAEFGSITVRPGGTRPILRDHRPPTNDAGHEFCVAWWLRGGCFPNCNRRATHVPFASANERTRLITFCRQHLAAPAAGSSGA